MYTHLFLGIFNNCGLCSAFSISLDALCPHVSKVNECAIASHPQYSCRSEASYTHLDRHTAISVQTPGNEMLWAQSCAPAVQCSHRHKLAHCTHTKYFIRCYKDQRLSNSGIVLLTMSFAMHWHPGKGSAPSFCSGGAVCCNGSVFPFVMWSLQVVLSFEFILMNFYDHWLSL